MIPLNAPSLGPLEQEYVADALSSGWVTAGLYVDRFESRLGRLTGRAHVVAVSSGTAALYLALRALDIRGPVLLPAYTCDAVCNAAIMAGLFIRIADAEAETFGMDFVDHGSTPLGAVVLAHTYGVLARESDYIVNWCEHRGVPLIEDASEAHGAMYANGQAAGGRGKVSIMSFRGEKTISGGQLGAVLTDDPEIARLARQWSHNGLPCDKVRYWATQPGLNMQPAHLNAALACAQLERLPELVSKRNAVHAGWIQAFGKVGLGPDLFQSPGPHTPAWWLTSINIGKFTRMLAGDLGVALDTLGIQTRPGFYPIHYYPHVHPMAAPSTPVADYLLRNLLILPSGPDITPIQQAQVVKAIGRICGAW
jgi:perosamine synthetase